MKQKLAWEKMRSELREEFEVLFPKGKSEGWRGKALLLWGEWECILMQARKDWEQTQIDGEGMGSKCDRDELMKNAEAIIQKRWGEMPKKKLSRKVGFYLQSHFGKGVWMLKDLDEGQLGEVIKQQNNRLAGLPCCALHPCKERSEKV
jgi:hypothetical protein